MKKVLKTILKIFMIIIWVSVAILLVEGHLQGLEAAKLYDKTEITKADLEVKSDYKTITEVGSAESGDLSYKIRKLSGAEYIGQIKLAENEGADITCTPGDAKILILDEQGQQRFYASVTELHVEPGEAGNYDVYLIGKRFTGKVTIEY